MSAATPTHYEILGLPATATQPEIKRRYRELARKHHPDVAKTSDAAARFRAISEAHSVLSDPTRRATYDAELKLKARAQRPGAGAGTGAGAGAASAGTGTQRPNNPTTQRPNAQRPATNAQSPSPEARRQAARRAELKAEGARRFEEARRAFARFNYREAENLCRQALQFDPGIVAAYELRGDIHQKRGRPEEALAMYSYAIQLDRNNTRVRVKLDHLAGQPSGATMAGTAARARRARGAAVPIHSAARTRLGISLAMGALILFMAYAIMGTRQPPAHSPWIFEWDPLLVLALGVSGLAAGIILSLNGKLEPASDALAIRRKNGTRATTASMGTLLGGFSLVLFHASAALYLILGSAQGALSRSILAAYVASYGLVCLFAVAARVAFWYVLMFGGNVVFVLFLLGWALGERFRDAT